ncbi:MAG: chromosomal replication initiator protein DnaA [Parcubacteria group bacterium]
MANEELWQAALGEIELSISKANFITWFKNTYVLSAENDKVVIGVPNGFAKEWLENKYNLYILRALRNIKPEIKEVSCIIASPENFGQKNASVDAIIPAGSRVYPVGDNTDYPQKIARISQESNLNPKYVFDNFVIGGSNELARAACYAVSQNLGKVYNPLFIYGGVGLGKTHLLQSIGNAVLKINPSRKVKYITSERFTTELIDSIKNQKVALFKDHYQKIDLLIIDDVQFLSGKEKTQEEFFHIFNFLYQLNKQIVLSSDRAPKAIPTLEERLRSRFEGGMIADVSRPDLETRIAILRRKAAVDGLEINDEALEFIAANITHNIRELEGALTRVAVSAQLLKRDVVDVKFATAVLSELISSGKKKGITHTHIIKAVSDYFDISQEDLVVKGRKQEVVRPRQIAMYLMRIELQYSFPGIGEKLGGRDHTTAIHAFEKITKELEEDMKLLEDITLLREKIYSLS